MIRIASLAPLAARWRRLPSNLRAIAWIMTGTLGFALNDVVTKVLGRTYDPLELALFRYGFGAIMLMPVMLRGGIAGFRTERFGLHLARIALASAAQVASYYAVIHMILADATAISFSRPLFTTIAAALILREAVDRGRWTATVVGFAGVLVMVRPGHNGVDPAALIAVGAAFAFAISIILIRMMARTEPPNRIMFYYHLVGAGLFVLPAALVWHAPQGLDWLLLALLAALQIFGMNGYVRALSVGEASAIAPFEYVRMIYAVGFGWFAFAELPDGWTFLGTAIIAGATVYIARRETRRGPRPATG
jgi:drug/metabolite transporter (DMT)-like permease